jgi:hypothetical protein
MFLLYSESEWAVFMVPEKDDKTVSGFIASYSYEFLFAKTWDAGSFKKARRAHQNRSV